MVLTRVHVNGGSMALINIKTSEEDKARVIDSIRKLKSQAKSVATIAKNANMNPNKVRFIMEDLIAENKIEKIAIVQYHSKYNRYLYIVKEATQ